MFARTSRALGDPSGLKLGPDPVAVALALVASVLAVALWRRFGAGTARRLVWCAAPLALLAVRAFERLELVSRMESWVAAAVGGVLSLLLLRFTPRAPGALR